MSKQPLNIGLFGFGTVGEGLYRVLQGKPSFGANIKKVCIRQPDKARNAPTELFTTNRRMLLSDSDINVIVELTDDAAAAFEITEAALRAGKHVVSANKALVAGRFAELLDLQRETGCSFLYEGACCASIPVIRNLEEYYDNDLLHGLRGIVNGSTNYILTKMFSEGLSFEDALLLAQVEGFAESDPTLDLNGTDAASKLSILLAHTYGIITKPNDLLRNGIEQLHPGDARFAREKGYRIRLVAQTRCLTDGSVAAFVLPQFVTPEDALYRVDNEYNSVLIESSLADTQAFFGKGAGAFPTSSAILSDLSALRYGYRYEYRRCAEGNAPTALGTDFSLRVYASFDELFQVPHEVFERIEEWYSTEGRCYVTGIVHFENLRRNDWWRRAGASLILLPDAIVENEPEAENHWLAKQHLVPAFT